MSWCSLSDACNPPSILQQPEPALEDTREDDGARMGSSSGGSLTSLHAEDRQGGEGLRLCDCLDRDEAFTDWDTWICPEVYATDFDELSYWASVIAFR